MSCSDSQFVDNEICYCIGLQTALALHLVSYILKWCLQDLLQLASKHSCVHVIKLGKLCCYCLLLQILSVSDNARPCVLIIYKCIKALKWCVGEWRFCSQESSVG